MRPASECPVSQIHRCAIILQPFFPFSVNREYFIYLTPKLPGVVHVVDMTEFVYDDVVDERGWSHHTFSMEREVTLERTRSPAVA